MPEGDTVCRTANTLRMAIEGHVVTAVETAAARTVPQPAGISELRGSRLEVVESRGKHLLMHFDQGLVLHSHMGMTGAWHLYHHGEPWKKPPQRAQIKLEFEGVVAVCFSPKVLECLTQTGLRRHRQLSRLGPDLLATTLDVAEVRRRFRAHDLIPLGEAILNQTIACGVGNVYKSEVLFLSQLDPFRPVKSYSDADLEQVVERSRRLMRRNLEGGPRRTRFGRDAFRLWVYDRRGQPCFQCGTEILMQRQGDLGRSTYWCPQCQATDVRQEPAPNAGA